MSARSWCSMLISAHHLVLTLFYLVWEIDVDAEACGEPACLSTVRSPRLFDGENQDNWSPEPEEEDWALTLL